MKNPNIEILDINDIDAFAYILYQYIFTGYYYKAGGYQKNNNNN